MDCHVPSFSEGSQFWVALLLFMAYVNYNYGSMAVPTEHEGTREQDVVYVAIYP